MKNNDSSPRHWGPARIAELYSGDNGSVACPGVAKNGLSVGSLPIILMENGQAVVVTCRAAVPERLSDMQLSSQTLLDNCAFRIVFAPDGASLEPIERGNPHD